MYLRGWGDVLLSGEEPVHLGQERSGPVGGSNASIGQVNNTTNNTDSPFIAASRASSAKITGEFQGVSFEAYARSDGGLRFSAAGGSGTLRNEGNEVIGSSPDLCVKAEEAPRLRLGCLGDLLFLEE